MTESPGQRIARELEEALNAGKGYGLIDAINVAIDARTELLEAEARHAALVLVRRERAGDGIACPFCRDDDFDAIGLKHHLVSGFCGPYNDVPMLCARAAEEEEG